MTGAGSAEIAFAVEESFRDVGDTPVWYQPGVNIEVGNASLERALQRARQPDDPRPAGSLEGRPEGAFSITFTLTDDNYHDLVFADSGTALASGTSFAPSATWYLKAGLPDGTDEERFVGGAAVESWTVNYNEGQEVTVELTIIYANELDPADADAPDVPSAINQPSEHDAVMWHAVDFELASSTVETLQSVTLSVAGMARFRPGQNLIYEDVVVGAYEPSITIDAILSDGEKRELAYGSAGATSVETTVDKQAGEFTLGSVATLDVVDIQPNSYDWQQLVGDEDTTDPIDAHVRTVEVAE